MELSEFQRRIVATYGDRDRARGVPATSPGSPRSSASWPRRRARAPAGAQRHEVGDVLAWLASLAAQLGVDLDDAASRYADGCPRCGCDAVLLPADVTGTHGPWPSLSRGR